MTYDEEGEILFTEEEIEQSLWKLETCPFSSWFEPLKDIKIYFHPAGHIMGAASILIHDIKNDIKILYSGDISIANQRTAEGCSPPSGDLFNDINLLIVESTYGGGFHPKRRMRKRNSQDGRENNR
jgi:metallo-beta-lactamase family protein